MPKKEFKEEEMYITSKGEVRLRSGKSFKAYMRRYREYSGLKGKERVRIMSDANYQKMLGSANLARNWCS